MQLDLKQVFQQESMQMPIEAEFDFSAEEIYGAYPFTRPVHAEGVVENQSAVVRLRYRATVEYKRECDRCLDEATAEYVYEFEHILAAVEERKGGASGESELLLEDRSDELVFVPDFRLDFEELVREDIVLEVPTRFLCRQECKGLCPKCGCNLNHSQCDCDLSEPDPRLAALRDLLSGADE